MRRALLPVLIACCSAACTNKSPTPDAAAKATPWSVAVVVVDTEDLESVRTTMLAELEAHPSSHVRLGIVLAEGAQSRLLQAGVDGRLVESTELAGGNIRDDATLTRLGQWLGHGTSRSAVVFWGHGRGWRGFGENPRRRDARHWSLPELRQSVAALQGALGRPIDVLGFDACLMGSWEVASELAPFARTMIASPELEPRRGWPIAGIITWLDQNIGASAPQLAEQAVNLFGASGHRHAMLDAFDLARIPDLDHAVDDLGNAAAAARCSVPASAEYRDPGARDLGGLAEALAAQCPSASAAAHAVESQLRAARIAHFCRGSVCGGAGLSIHAEHAASDSAYLVRHAAGWQQWVASAPATRP